MHYRASRKQSPQRRPALAGDAVRPVLAAGQLSETELGNSDYQQLSANALLVTG